VLADPALLAEPAMPDPVLADPVLADPVLVDPVLVDPVVAEPVLSDLGPAAGAVLSVGLELGPREAGGVDGGDTGFEELTGGGTVAVTGGLAVVDGRAELDWQEGVVIA
jgi:hypothetical protein